MKTTTKSWSLIAGLLILDALATLFALTFFSGVLFNKSEGPGDEPLNYIGVHKITDPESELTTRGQWISLQSIGKDSGDYFQTLTGGETLVAQMNNGPYVTVNRRDIEFTDKDVLDYPYMECHYTTIYEDGNFGVADCLLHWPKEKAFPEDMKKFNG